MGSGDRFYLLEMSNRPAVWGDIGNLIKIEGLVVGGSGAQAILLLPSATEADSIPMHRLTDEEWSDFIRRSDDPEVLVGNAKIFQRKLRYEISGAVQQKVWAADGFKCMYCGRPMGQVQLTIDHLIPLELGGANDPSNYVSACRKCNKDKGSQEPREWCKEHGVDFDGLRDYLKNRKLP